MKTKPNYQFPRTDADLHLMDNTRQAINLIAQRASWYADFCCAQEEEDFGMEEDMRDNLLHLDAFLADKFPGLEAYILEQIFDHATDQAAEGGPGAGGPSWSMLLDHACYAWETLIYRSTNRDTPALQPTTLDTGRALLAEIFAGYKRFETPELDYITHPRFARPDNPRSSGVGGFASITENVIAARQDTLTPMLLVHEASHLLTPSWFDESHGIRFRQMFERLIRRHLKLKPGNTEMLPGLEELMRGLELLAMDARRQEARRINEEANEPTVGQYREPKQHWAISLDVEEGRHLMSHHEEITPTYEKGHEHGRCSPPAGGPGSQHS